MHRGHLCSGAALLIAGLSMPGRPLVAQQTSDSTTLDYSQLTDSALGVRAGYNRNARTAVVLGAVVPGLGYLYAGEWLKSYPTFVTSVGGVAFGALIFDFDRCTFAFLDPGCRRGVPIGARIAGTALVAAGLVIWGRSAIDAGDAVERERARWGRNERFRHATRTTLGSCPAAPRAWCAGLRIATQ